MQQTPVETLFYMLDETATIIQESIHCSFLEALVETGENLFQETILQDELSEWTKKRLQKKYEAAALEMYTSEQIRQAWQLAMIKGMKETVQANHQMTPDSIGLIISYLVEKFLQNTNHFTMLDPAVGTGNLLMTMMHQLHRSDIQAYGVDVDDVLIKLAYTGANLQKKEVTLFCQDSLALLMIDPVDVIVCDLPIGYYPNQINAAKYQLNRESGQAFAHHLLIEQSIKHTKPGGYLFFLIPNNLFHEDESKKLHDFLKQEVYIQGIMQLPKALFKNEASGKTIFIIQKKQQGLKPPKQVLLADLPKLSNKEAMMRIFAQIDVWLQENKS